MLDLLPGDEVVMKPPDPDPLVSPTPLWATGRSFEVTAVRQWGVICFTWMTWREVAGFELHVPVSSLEDAKKLQGVAGKSNCRCSCGATLPYQCPVHVDTKVKVPYRATWFEIDTVTEK
jgi:hypothetical protein